MMLLCLFGFLPTFLAASKDGYMGSLFTLRELKDYYEESDFVIGGHLNSPLKRSDEMVYAEFATAAKIYKNSLTTEPKRVYFGRLSRFEPWPDYDQYAPVIIFGKYQRGDDAFVTALSNIDSKISLDKFVEDIKSKPNASPATSEDKGSSSGKGSDAKIPVTFPTHFFDRLNFGTSDNSGSKDKGSSSSYTSDKAGPGKSTSGNYDKIKDDNDPLPTGYFEGINFKKSDDSDSGKSSKSSGSKYDSGKSNHPREHTLQKSDIGSKYHSSHYESPSHHTSHHAWEDTDSDSYGHSGNDHHSPSYGKDSDDYYGSHDYDYSQHTPKYSNDEYQDDSEGNQVEHYTFNPMPEDRRKKLAELARMSDYPEWNEDAGSSYGGYGHDSYGHDSYGHDSYGSSHEEEYKPSYFHGGYDSGNSHSSKGRFVSLNQEEAVHKAERPKGDYFKQRRSTIPKPTGTKENRDYINVPADVKSKVAILGSNIGALPTNKVVVTKKNSLRNTVVKHA